MRLKFTRWCCEELRENDFDDRNQDHRHER